MKPFPFLWGAATSSHQVEGDNRHNDWWAWEQAGRLKEPSGIACDHYRRFREDFDLAKSLGHNAHRFSLEWSRFEPRENEWNDEAFRHYEEVLKEMAARGLEPVVTLHHFTNPEWLAQKGGWLNPEIVGYFARYVEKVVRAYAPHARLWITINEPLVYVYHAFFSGQWPPGVTSYGEALKVIRHLLHAHVAAYKVIHRVYAERKLPVWVSVAKHVGFFSPFRPASLLDRLAVFLRNWFFNDMFIETLQTGFLFFPGIFCEFLDTHSTLDFIGLNYYTRDFIQFGGLSDGKMLGVAADKDLLTGHAQELNVMGWEVYPRGLYRLLKRFSRFGLPMIITENGICAKDDIQRERFIRAHVDSVARARSEGIPVFGYLYWSLLDNFEWAYGFEPRFGIIEVDYKTQQRKIRKSAYVLSEICRKIETGG